MSSILGNNVIRREDPRFLTGAGTYVANLVPEGAAHLVYVRSTVAHGTIVELDVEEARKAPGVLGVFTGAEVRSALGDAPKTLPMFPDTLVKPFLAVDRVRHVGEPVVAVVAETVAQAVDAAELVFVEYDFLDALVDPEAAIDSDVLLHPEHGSNVFNTMSSQTQADFADCEVVVSERIVNQRLTGAPIEPRSGMATWTDDGRLVHHSACQGAHPTKALLAGIYGLDPAQVHVIVPDVGGGFGAKSRTYPEEAVLGWYSKQVGRPVAWTESRTENVQAMPQGRGQIQYATIGGTRDGLITAYQLDVVQDIGAYPLIGAVLAGMTQRMLTGTYEIRNVGFNATNVLTSMPSVTAYRGAGRPEAAVAIERMIDRFADEIGVDPAEVRRKNMVPRFTEPYQTGIGTTYDVGDYPEALRLALEAVDYEAVVVRQAARRVSADPRLLGIGIGMYVEITAGAPGSEYGSVELRPDGSVVARSGATPFGQGHDTTWAMIVADRTGIDIERIEVVRGDTDLVPRGALTVGSRSVQVGGSALAAASAQLVDAAKEKAASLLEAAPADVALDTDSGRFHVVGTPAVSVSWDDVAGSLADSLIEEHDFAAEMPTFPSGCHVAVVEVDRDTGGVQVLQLVAVDDAGTVLNPMLVDGQVHGGIAQGVAQVLFEAIQYDEDGNLVTAG
ncbi:MAG: xanthine dehydrogenase family protein molybdopterin-binding subunit, partial [Acidimicrobiales bacterium]|nr:xanthine dehydrogenase family protein molybdopterin-binding subunit [Acidimicrobiales bacterium]